MRSRLFAVIAGCLAWTLASPASDPPAVALDHLVLGISDLERGRRMFEREGGVLPAIGGVHPDRGTWNALLSVGERTYLEIIAPNPEAQALDPMFAALRGLDTPTPILWLLRTSDADRTVASLRDAGYEVADPEPGSRTTPDGRVLRWRTFALTAPPSAIAPFFIEWAADAPHPATTSPTGCRLGSVALADPKPDELRKLLSLLGVDLPVTEAEKAMLGFTVDCPAGKLEFP